MSYKGVGLMHLSEVTPIGDSKSLERGQGKGK